MEERQMISWRVIGALAALAAVGACSSSSDGATTETQSPCANIQVDPLKEIEIVDESITTDPRVSNAAGGVWSFRHVVESLTDADPSKFASSWLQTWELDSYNNEPLNLEPRGDQMRARILCPWLKSTPENKCDATCSTCTETKLDLAKAPFRLLAIANRMDLRSSAKPAGPSGEGRLVFGLTDGPGDAPTSVPLAMTVIFEFALPSTKTPKQWADAWHHLATYPDHGDAYKAARRVDRGLRRASWTGEGQLTRQARTNESVTNWIWQLRQFRLDAGGMFALTATSDTPTATLNNSAQLIQWAKTNSEAIKQNKYSVPEYMLAPSANEFLFRWTLDGVDEPTRRAFAAGTCNGCHSAENPGIDNAFHISPFRKGSAKLSPFLWESPGNYTPEMKRRIGLVQDALCLSP